MQCTQTTFHLILNLTRKHLLNALVLIRVDWNLLIKFCIYTTNSFLLLLMLTLFGIGWNFVESGYFFRGYDSQYYFLDPASIHSSGFLKIEKLRSRWIIFCSDQDHVSLQVILTRLPYLPISSMKNFDICEFWIVCLINSFP